MNYVRTDGQSEYDQSAENREISDGNCFSTRQMHPILESANNRVQQMREKYCEDECDEGTPGQPQYSENAGNEENRHQDGNRSPVQESHKKYTCTRTTKRRLATNGTPSYVTVSALYRAMSP